MDIEDNVSRNMYLCKLLQAVLVISQVVSIIY